MAAAEGNEISSAGTPRKPGSTARAWALMHGGKKWWVLALLVVPAMLGWLVVLATDNVAPFLATPF